MIQINNLMPLAAVLEARGMYPRGRSSQYADIKAGLYPKPVKISARNIGWPESEVAAMNASRIAGKTDDEIRALVRKLEAARKDVT
jgi:prophage regulatory protein